VYFSHHWTADGQRRDDLHETEHVVLEAASGKTIALTQDHLLPVLVNGTRSVNLAARHVVPQRDYIQDVETGPSLVVAARRQVRSGLYLPATQSGQLVVDGIVASCYTDKSMSQQTNDALFAALARLQRLLPGAVFARLVGAMDMADGYCSSWTNGYSLNSWFIGLGLALAVRKAVTLVSA
jgi:hypothetical protein